MPPRGRIGTGASSLTCEDARVPGWLDFDRLRDWVSGEWWSYPVIFAVALLDAFFPAVPSETLVVIGGNLASSGDMHFLLVVLAGATGAIIGDNISFGIGHLVGERTVKRLLRSEKWHGRLEWAERTLDERGAYIILIARFIPGGRTAVTFSAGYVPTFPWRRFIVYDVTAGILWATYAASLGYFGGKTFEDHPWLGLALALGIALTAGLLVEVVRHTLKRRRERAAPREDAKPESGDA
jgi:membrane-associated protein